MYNLIDLHWAWVVIFVIYMLIVSGFTVYVAWLGMRKGLNWTKNKSSFILGIYFASSFLLSRLETIPTHVAMIPFLVVFWLVLLISWIYAMWLGMRKGLNWTKKKSIFAILLVVGGSGILANIIE